MINYSILIPHKNQPLLLQKCINSVPLRDDVQIIVVDDNSDPEIVDFNNFPGKDNPMVEVYFTKEGKGAGYARNVGLPFIKGKWMTVIGSDDFFNPCLNEAMDLFVNSDYDVIFFKGNSIYLDGTISARGSVNNEAVDKAINTGDFTDVLLLSADARKFYRMEFINKYNIKYNEVRWSNDVVFMSKVALYVDKCFASDLAIYCVTESETCLTKAKSLESKVVRFIEECKSVKILKFRYGHCESIYFWLFNTWYNIYKINKYRAFLYLFYATRMGGIGFIKQIIKALK